MSVGIVAAHARGQPDHAPKTQCGPQPHLDLLPGPPAVAVGVEQALLGDEADPGAVDVDGASLQHDPRSERGQSEGLVDTQRDRVVGHVIGVLEPPGIEPPVDQRQRLGAGVTGDEGRAVVPDPYVHRRDAVEDHPARVHADAAEPRRRRGLGAGVVDQQVHHLARGQYPDDLDPGLPHPVEVVRPGIRVVGPRQPGRCVRLPFRGHPVTRALRVGERRRRTVPVPGIPHASPTVAHCLVHQRPTGPTQPGSSSSSRLERPR